jgi:gamma-glutamyl:cysteine ligase YbdK (ATP-grasp superfamily)
MAKARTTVTLEEEVFRAVRIEAARTGKRESQVIEASLRRDLGLDVLKDIWAQVNPASEAEAMDLAYTEIHAMREERDAAGGP